MMIIYPCMSGEYPSIGSRNISFLGKFKIWKLAFYLENVINVIKTTGSLGTIHEVYLCKAGSNQANCSQDISFLEQILHLYDLL